MNKYKYIIPLLFFCICFQAHTQSKTKSSTIDQIRKIYKEINSNLSSYKKEDKEINESVEGGTMVVYSYKKEIKKIEVIDYGEMGRWKEEFYFDQQKLVFYFTLYEKYDSPLSGNVMETEENRFYFDQHKLIKWINKTGKETPSNDSSFLEKEKEIIDRKNELIKK